MIFTFLITIVFIAEMIIAIVIFMNLKRLSRAIRNCNLTLIYLKPSIREISELSRKISEQLVEFSQDFAQKLKNTQEEFLLKNLAKVLLSAFFIKKFKRVKVPKFISKGLSLLQIVV